MSNPIPIVRLIISNSAGRALILKRANTGHAPGAWCLPGGKINYGETVKEAAERETREETSFVCVSTRFLFYQDSLPLESGAMHCINLYLECAVQGNIALNHESSRFAWIGPEDLPNYEIAFRNDTALIRYWKQTGTWPQGMYSKG